MPLIYDSADPMGAPYPHPHPHPNANPTVGLSLTLTLTLALTLTLGAPLYDGPSGAGPLIVWEQVRVRVRRVAAP